MLAQSSQDMERYKCPQFAFLDDAKVANPALNRMLNEDLSSSLESFYIHRLCCKVCFGAFVFTFHP